MDRRRRRRHRRREIAVELQVPVERDLDSPLVEVLADGVVLHGEERRPIEDRLDRRIVDRAFGAERKRHRDLDPVAGPPLAAERHVRAGLRVDLLRRAVDPHGVALAHPGRDAQLDVERAAAVDGQRAAALERIVRRLRRS